MPSAKPGLSASHPAATAAAGAKTAASSSSRPLHVTWGGGGAKSTSSSHHPQQTNKKPQLMSYRNAEECFEAERSALLKDLADLQRVVQQKDTERSRLVARAAETEKALRQQSQLYKSKLDKALAEKQQLEVSLKKHQHHHVFHGGHQDEALFTRITEERETSQRETAELRVMVSDLGDRCNGLEEEKAAMQHMLGQREGEVEALKDRVQELAQWLETTGSERAAMVALLQNGSEQCRAVLAAEGMGKASSSSSSVSSVAQRRVHLEKIKGMLKEFAHMLSRLEHVPCFSADAPLSPKRYHHNSHHKQHACAASPTRQAFPSVSPKRYKQLAFLEEEDSEEEEEEGGKSIQAKYAKAQEQIAALQAQLHEARRHHEREKGGIGGKQRLHQHQPSPLPTQAELLARDNHLMQDRLEKLLSTALLSTQKGTRVPLLEEAEKLLTQSASRFYALATRLQEKEEEDTAEGERTPDLVPAVQAFGRDLGHLRRLLVATEHLVLCQEEERECLAFFFGDVFGVDGGFPAPALQSDASPPSSSTPHLPPPALQLMLAECSEKVEAWKHPPKAAALPSKREKQLQEALAVLRKAVLSIVPASSSSSSSTPIPTEELAAALKEKWMGMCQAAAEGKRLERQTAVLTATIDRLEDEREEAVKELQASCEERDSVLGAEVRTLRQAVAVALEEMGGESPKASASASSRQVAHALMQALSACKAVLVQEKEGLEASPPRHRRAPPPKTVAKSLKQLLEEYCFEAQTQVLALQTRVGEAEETNQGELDALQDQVTSLGRLEEAVRDVLGELAHHPQLGRVLSGQATTRQTVDDVAARLRQAVATLKRELDGRGKDLERMYKEAKTNQGIQEVAVAEAKEEVGLLRKVLQVYEEALYGALSKGADEEEDEEEAAKRKNKLKSSNSSGFAGAHAAVAQGNELARRLQEHVLGLRRQVDEKTEECFEIEEARMVERRELWEEALRWKEKASLYLRLLTSLEEAARTVVVTDGEEGKKKGVGGRTGASPPLGLDMAVELEEGHGMEAIKGLCVRLLQYGARTRGARKEGHEDVDRLQQQLAAKEKEGHGLRETLRAQATELARLREKARASFEEVTTLKQKIALQEADVSSLVSSVSRVSSKLTRLRSSSQSQGSEDGLLAVSQSGNGHGGEGMGNRQTQQSQQQQQEEAEVRRLRALVEDQVKTIETLATRIALLEEEGQEGWPEELEHLKAQKEGVERELHTLRRGLVAREKEWSATLTAVNKERERLQRKVGKQAQVVQSLSEQLDQSLSVSGSKTGRVIEETGEEEEEEQEA